MSSWTNIASTLQYFGSLQVSKTKAEPPDNWWNIKILKMLYSNLVVNSGWKSHWFEDKIDWNECKLSLWFWKAWLLRLWVTILSRSNVMKINKRGMPMSCFLKFEIQGNIWQLNNNNKNIVWKRIFLTQHLKM